MESHLLTCDLRCHLGERRPPHLLEFLEYPGEILGSLSPSSSHLNFPVVRVFVEMAKQAWRSYVALEQVDDTPPEETASGGRGLPLRQGRIDLAAGCRWHYCAEA